MIYVISIGSQAVGWTRDEAKADRIARRLEEIVTAANPVTVMSYSNLPIEIGMEDLDA